MQSGLHYSMMLLIVSAVMLNLAFSGLVSSAMTRPTIVASVLLEIISVPTVDQLISLLPVDFEPSPYNAYM